MAALLDLAVELIQLALPYGTCHRPAKQQAHAVARCGAQRADNCNQKEPPSASIQRSRQQGQKDCSRDCKCLHHHVRQQDGYSHGFLQEHNHSKTSARANCTILAAVTFHGLRALL